VDPKGRTIREIVAEEFAKPLGLEHSLSIGNENPNQPEIGSLFVCDLGMPEGAEENGSYFRPTSPLVEEVKSRREELDAPKELIEGVLDLVKAMDEGPAGDVSMDVMGYKAR